MIQFLSRNGAPAPVESGQRGAKVQSSYLEGLPALYRDDEFMGQFLLIFESVLKPIENTVDNLALYFDPRLAPESLLLWLASWLDLALDSPIPILRRRELVRSAAELYRWRGTKQGLSEYLRICTGIVPEISEHTPGMRLAPETRLGIDTQLGSSGAGYHFTVSMKLDSTGEVSANTIKAIIEAQKPAHTVYTLQITGGDGKGEARETLRSD